MEKYTKEFITLVKCYNEIMVFQKGVNVDIDIYAKRFLLEMKNINIQYQLSNISILDIREMLKVQRIISRITGKRCVSRGLRLQILEESLVFNEIVESVRVKKETMEISSVK